MQRHTRSARRITGFILGIILLALPGAAPWAATLYVDGGYGNQAPGTGTSTDPFHLIQSAIDAAAPGDTALVAPGTYIENLIINKEHLTLIGAGAGEDPDAHTIIDGSHAGYVVAIDQISQFDLQGVTICNGIPDSGRINGGGMVITSSGVFITDCLITGNGRDGAGSVLTERGGGIYVYASEVAVYRTVFEDNHATRGGGGMAAYYYSHYQNELDIAVTLNACTFSNNTSGSNSLTKEGGGGLLFDTAGDTVGGSATGRVEGCFFEGNISPLGGGLCVDGPWHLTIANSSFFDNQAVSPASPSSSAGKGGGLYLFEARPVVKNCVFSGNRTGTLAWSHGGGIYNEHNDSVNYEEAIFVNCTFRSNVAQYRGGGIYNENYASPEITNCSFWNNQAEEGGGLANVGQSRPIIRNSTLTGNTAVTGGGIYGLNTGLCNWSAPVECQEIYNTIIWGNSSTGTDRRSIAEFDNSGSYVWDSDIAGGYYDDPVTDAGRRVIDVNPQFISAVSGNLHLVNTSPCRDIGNNGEIAADSADLDDDVNTVETVPFDIDGEVRVIRDVDLGADEVSIPTNDSCTTTIDVTTGTTTGNLSVAVPGSETLSCVNANGEPALWYRYTAPFSGTLEVSTCGSNYLLGSSGGIDTVLSVHSGCPATDANTLACNDDWGSGGCPEGACQDSDLGGSTLDSAVCVDVILGQSYLIRVSRYANTSGGSFLLNLTFNPPEVWVDDDWAWTQTGMDPDGDGPATSFGVDAFATIQQGIDNVAAPGTVNVLPGTYVENIRLRSQVAVVGAGGGREPYTYFNPEAQSIIDGNNQGTVVSAIDNFNAVLEGFRIVGGTGTPVPGLGYAGGGIFIENGGVTIRRCLIMNNVADTGAGLLAYRSTTGAYLPPPVVDSVFFANTAGLNGGAIANVGLNTTITGCRFAGNAAAQKGVSVYHLNARSTLVNCLITENHTADVPLIAENNAGSTLTHCTIWSSEDLTAALETDNAIAATLTNCIVSWGGHENTAGFTAYPISDTGSAATVVNHSDIHNGSMTAPGTGNINASPLFADPRGEYYYFWDFHLWENSACIDAGDNGAPSVPAADFDDNPRPVDGDRDGNAVVDMGAYELNHDTLFVKHDAVGANDGSSWEDAFTDLQDALDAAHPGRTVWVARGTYQPSQPTAYPGKYIYIPESVTFVVGNWMTLHGGFSGNEVPGAFDLSQRIFDLDETILDGEIGEPGDDMDNSRCVVKVVGASLHPTLISGFTIVNGNGMPGCGSAGVPCRSGGMKIEGGIVAVNDVRFLHNQSDWGGGAFVSYGEATFTRCSFENNTALVAGGGAYGDGSTVDFNDCVFVSNEARYGGGCAGNSNSDIHLNHTLFVSNQAQENGGGGYFYSDTTISGSRFMGNQADGSGGAVWGAGKSHFYSSTLFSGNYAGVDGGAIFTDTPEDDLQGFYLSNCTLASNHANQSGGGVVYNFYNNYFRNSILWGNRAGSGNGNQLVVAAGLFSYNHGVIEDGDSIGGGIISDDPRFVSPVDHTQAPTIAGDYHIGFLSPCRNTAYNAAVVDTVDVDREPRIVDEYVDMGADEYLDTDGDSMPDYWEDKYGTPNAGGDPDQDGLTNLEELNRGTDPTRYDTDGDGFTDLAEAAIGTDPNDDEDFPASKTTTVYVDDDWTATPPGTDPDPGDGFAMVYGWDAFDRIGLGILHVGIPPDPPVGGGGRVHVLPGTYVENIVLCSDIYIAGLPDETEATIIDGGGSGVVVRADNVVNTFMDRLTITNGSSINGGGFYLTNSWIVVDDCHVVDNTAHYGAGMRLVSSSPTILNSTFERNVTGYGGSGGAINNDGSSPQIERCRFLGNHASNGGAIRNWGTACQPEIHNSLFVGNTADFVGGAVSNANASNATTINCSFFDNTAATGPAISNQNGSSLNLVNGIVWDSGADAISNDGTALVDVTFSDIQQAGGTYSGTGNINADPLIAVNPHPGADAAWGTLDDDYGDLHLAAGSPCIDAGDSTVLEPGVDIDAEPRTMDDPATVDTGNGIPPIVDMGADEYVPDTSCMYDLDGDGDADGSDLAVLAADPALVGLGDFALDFGKAVCE